jgi:hypothetical protein
MVQPLPSVRIERLTSSISAPQPSSADDDPVLPPSGPSLPVRWITQVLSDAPPIRLDPLAVDPSLLPPPPGFDPVAQRRVLDRLARESKKKQDQQQKMTRGHQKAPSPQPSTSSSTGHMQQLKQHQPQSRKSPVRDGLRSSKKHTGKQLEIEILIINCRFPNMACILFS